MFTICSAPPSAVEKELLGLMPVSQIPSRPGACVDEYGASMLAGARYILCDLVSCTTYCTVEGKL
jgi:hypothetical protein